jgi:hypothetical protein
LIRRAARPLDHALARPADEVRPITKSQKSRI